MEPELELLKNYLNNRIKLCEQYPKYQGRHQIFQYTLEKIKNGIDILEKKDKMTLQDKSNLYKLGKEFVNIRNNEIISHNNRFNTNEGNQIHHSETLLYSMVLDVFQSYGSNISI